MPYQERRENMALHMKRKYYHWLCSLLAFVVVCLEDDYRRLILYAGIALAVFTVFEIIHLVWPPWDLLRKNGCVECLRPHERNGITSSFWLAFGFFLTCFFREKEIILLAVVYAGFCDPVAEIAGHHFLTPHWSNSSQKTIGGSLAFFFVGLLISGLTAKFISHDPRFLNIALIGSLTAASIEAMELKFFGRPVSDNLLVPVLTASLLKLFFF